MSGRNTQQQHKKSSSDFNWLGVLLVCAILLLAAFNVADPCGHYIIEYVFPPHGIAVHCP